MIGNAVRAMRVTTGEAEETFAPEPVKNAAAVEMSTLGGGKRAREHDYGAPRGQCEEGGGC